MYIIFIVSKSSHVKTMKFANTNIHQIYDILELCDTHETYNWTVIPAGKPWKMHINISENTMCVENEHAAADCKSSFVVLGKWITSTIFCIVSVPSTKLIESQQIISAILTAHTTYIYNSSNISVVTTQQMFNLTPAEFIGCLVDLSFTCCKLHALKNISIGCIKQVSTKLQLINVYNMNSNSLLCVSAGTTHDTYYIEPELKHMLNVATYADSKFMNRLCMRNLKSMNDDNAIAYSDDEEDDNDNNTIQLLLNCKWNITNKKYHLANINTAMYDIKTTI